MKLILRITLVAAMVLTTLSVNAQRSTIPQLHPIGFEFRNLGAFRINSWVGEFAVPLNPGEDHKYTWYAASRNGGVWKTVNSGTTFECITGSLGVSAIGDVEVAPSDPNIVWVGTGEDFNTRISNYGNGIWKSTDAGETFENMGLKDSHHIAEIIIHPQNPDIVWVAVMGHLFSENKERGVFKTENGGKSWKKVLYINKATGVIDIAINSQNPDILYASAYEKVRTPWTFVPGGEYSRIYKTVNGGSDWEVIEGGGFPSGSIGRIGIDVQYNNPDVVVAVVQNLNLKPGADQNTQFEFDEFTDKSFDNLIGGECYRSLDAGKTWERINDPEKVDVSGKAGYSFNKINIDPDDPDKIYIIGSGQFITLDGGKTWPNNFTAGLFSTNFGDTRSLWIDPRDGQHMLLGDDAGAFESWDGGKNMRHYYNIPIGEIYRVEVDDEDPYNIYIGLQDHEAWKSPVNSWSGQNSIKDWVISGMWDGMFTKVDHEDNKWLYFTTQFGKHHRVNQATGERVSIAPVPPEGEERYRYTWTAPIMLSPHNSSILYAGAQKLLRSLDRGDTWEEISPDLTKNDKVKIAGTGHIMYCTITSMDESVLKPGLIWVGTDDGKVHVTKNHGADWEELTNNVEKAGVPHERWVGRIVASKHDVATAYLIHTGFRNDDFKPYVLKTSDYGKTWKSISSNLPDSPVSVIIEDAKNPNLLFIGNDHGVYYTLDGGIEWEHMKANIPFVPVRDLVIHPRENDLVIGTFGRAAWVGDISPLQQMSREVAESEFHLFDIEPKPQLNYSQQASWGNYHMLGSNQIRTPNEPNGLELWFWFKEDGKGKANLVITDMDDKRVFRGEVPAGAGIKKIYWNTIGVEPGTYKVSLTYNEKTITKKGVVEDRLIWPVLNYKE